MKRQFDIGVVGVHPLGDLAPQPARFHDVGLVDLAEPAPALQREIEAGADDALDLNFGVDLGIDAAAGAVRHPLDAARLAEIDAARQFAHDHQIETGDEIALQGRGVGQRVEHHRRAQIGEQIHFLAQLEEAALGAQFERDRLPFRAADRAEQHRVRGHRLGQRGVGQRHAGGVIGGAADEALGNLEAGDVAAIEELDHAHHLAHDLGADAVTRQNQDLAVGAAIAHRSSPSSIAEPAGGGTGIRVVLRAGGARW